MHFLIPKVKRPDMIIIVLTIKLLFAIDILKYLFISKFILLIPPDEKPNKYIRPPVMPHIIPAIIINIYMFKFNGGILFVIRTKSGYIKDASKELFTTSLDKNKYAKIRVIKLITNIITDAFILIAFLISRAKPCVPPVTKFNGFNIKLKLRDAIKINIVK